MTNFEARSYEATIDAAVDAGDHARAEALADDYRREAGPMSGPDSARSPPWRAAYFAGQVALGAGRLRRALDLLLPLLGAARRLPPELASRLRLLLAEAHARQNQALEARTYLVGVPTALLEKHPPLSVRWLRIRLLLDDVSLLGDALARCDAALTQRGDADNRALLLCEEGRAWDRAGDLTRAADCWQRAERLTAPAPGVDAIRADVLLQLGRLEHLRGRLGPALDRFEAALGCATPGGQTLELNLRVLLVRLDLNQGDLARAAANQLLAGLSAERFPEEIRPLADMVRGLLNGTPSPNASLEEEAYHAALRGDTTAATALYQFALAANPGPERRARLALALGLLTLGHTQHHEARSWLSQAEELARSHGLPEVLLRALLVSGQMAAEQQGDDDLARKYFEEATLLAEVQAHQLSAYDAQTYRQGRTGVLRRLLRSACRRGDAPAVFRYQELERGRLLLDLLRTNPVNSPLVDQPDVAAVEADIAACERDLLAVGTGPEEAERRLELFRRLEENFLHRDRLFEEFLRRRSGRGTSLLPALPALADLRRLLPAGTVYMAPVLLEDELFLLTVRRDDPEQVLRIEGSGRALIAALDTLRTCLTAQLARYRRGLPLGRPERVKLDGLLEALGAGPLGTALADALGSSGSRQRVLWVPDGPLHGAPVHALRRGGRYLIEEADFVFTFSGALFVHQSKARGRRRWFGPAVAVTEAPSVLPEAQREGEGVVASFLRGRLLPAGAVDRKSLRPWLARAQVAHFACHADVDGRRPLTARLLLPSGEPIYALEWLEEPVAGLALVTLSACRSAEVAPLRGQEVFGHVTGLLGGGVRSVLAGLWPLADQETRPFMWRFYRHRLLHDLPTALSLAQREALADADGSPLFWAAHVLFGDPAALPAPSFWWRWLARLRQRRHRRRFATGE